MKVAMLWACAVVFAIAVGAAPARAGDSVLRIGIITDMSGQYSDGNGSGSVIAAQMAAEEIGGSVAGRKIEIISGDHQNKADIASAIVRRSSMDTKHVDVVAEGVNCRRGAGGHECRARAQRAVPDLRRRLFRHHRQVLHADQYSLDLRHLCLLERHRQGGGRRAAASPGSSSPPTIRSAMRSSATPAKR